MPRRVLLSLSVLVLLGGASDVLAPRARAEDEPDRGPRVVRSVLDGRARMVTIPLHPDMWVAYDATTCRLTKAWAGDVSFDGAVYTAVHGPQPTSRGAVWVRDERPDGHALALAADDHPLDLAPATTRYLGYRLHDEGVELRWELVSGDVRVPMSEIARYVDDDPARPVLERRITVGTPTGGSVRAVWLLLSAHGSPSKDAITADGEPTILNAYRSRPAGAGRLYDIEAMALAKPGTTTVVRTVFDRAAVLAEAQALAAEARAEAAAAAAAASEPEAAPVPEHPADTPLGHGVSVRVYHVGTSMAQLRTLVPGQTPNWSHVIPVLDLRTERGDFGGATDEFITHVDGFLDIPADGTYAFQLVSDDGSRLWIDDAVVIDHDGLHGSTAREGEVALTKGRHKLFVEHFENGGGEQLTLSWRPPGATSFAVVPNAVLLAPKGEVRVTSPGTKKLETVVPRHAPGDGGPLDGVHPAFDLMTTRPEGFEPRVGGMGWLPDGRLVICCWEPRGGVYVLDGVRGHDRAKITVKRIAEGLAEPLGLRVVDGRIFVLQKQELTELIDHDGDEVIDEYRCVANGWGVTANFHEFAFGLVHKDGFFYATLATAIDPGGASTQPQDPDRGKVVKIAMDGSFTYVAQGLRTPNGIGIGVDGEIFITDNQGDWLPVSKLLHLREGAFYGSRSVDFEGTAGKVETPPVVWLPQGEIGNSPGEPGLLTDGPYAGQMAHAEVTHGGLKRVFVEKVGGVYQGCVFRFTQGLEAGINRWTRGPDGAIHVGGIGSSGNWGQAGKLRHGLQRLTYNGTSVFEMLAVRARDGGFEIEFTEPLADPSGLDPQDFQVTQWRYQPTKEYGGPKLDVQSLDVHAVVRSEDRRRVALFVAGLRPGHVVHIRLARSVRGVGGKAPWSTEAWYTLHAMPEGVPPSAAGIPPPPVPNRLTPAEARAGWRLLFDGEHCEQWRGFRREDLPGAWSAVGGTLAFDPKHEDRGDIVTKAEYESYVLELEWRIAERGNSGVMFHVGEAHDAPWATGPEMQILDNEGHPDGRAAVTSAGANYALVAPAFDVTRPPGCWNRARLVVDGTRVEHWLNGWKLLEYELGSEAWKALVAESKFASMPAYGSLRKGRICLQDHGDAVAFRNVRILPLER